MSLCRQVAGGAHPPRLLCGEPGGHVPAVVQRQVPVYPAPSGELTSQASQSCSSILPSQPGRTAKEVAWKLEHTTVWSWPPSSAMLSLTLQVTTKPTHRYSTPFFVHPSHDTIVSVHRHVSLHMPLARAAL